MTKPTDPMEPHTRIALVVNAGLLVALAVGAALLRGPPAVLAPTESVRTDAIAANLTRAAGALVAAEEAAMRTFLDEQARREVLRAQVIRQHGVPPEALATTP